jgi:hypothetical protein
VKDLSIGGVVMLENTSGEPETIVEPMVVNKVIKPEMCFFQPNSLIEHNLHEIKMFEAR